MQTKEELYSALGISDFEYGEIKKRLGREPNEVETYLFSAMWSEHCGYSHSKKYLSRFPKAGSMHSEENAGGVQIGNQAVFFKAESHNHPSAVEPFHAASTGAGGVFRDIIALGARPVALLSSLKFGKLNQGNTKELFKGVIEGAAYYCNTAGIPAVAGELGFEPCYQSSPLCNVMAVGFIDVNDIKLSAAPPNSHVIIAGCPTGRDGVHGASFASKELDVEKDEPKIPTGDPNMGKALIEATMEILRLDDTLACQDCGAAGLLSSTSEMAYKGKCGMELYLDKVHLVTEGMEPWETMLSETQERMIFVTTTAGVQKVLAIADKYGVPAREIGKTIEQNEYRLFHNGEMVANLPPSILNDGVYYDLDETEPAYIKEYQSKKYTSGTSVEDAVMKVLADPNFASKNWACGQFDDTLGGRTVLGATKAGAAGIKLEEEGGVVGLTMDSNGRMVFLDPYNGSKNTMYESYRNLVSSGFKPLGLTDCLNYGNPEKSEVGYQFVKSIDGLADGCRELSIPVVSGNVSLYNEVEGIRVYPTPTIGMVGYAKKPEDVIAASFGAGETVYLLGKQITEDSKIGGSLYQMVLSEFLGGEIDKVDPTLEKALEKAIFALRDSKLIGGAVDVSEGGLLGALLEGLFGGNSGFSGSIINTKDTLVSLFGEINGRYVVSTKNETEFEKIAAQNGAPFTKLGTTNAGGEIAFDSYKFSLQTLKNTYETAIAKEMRN